MSSDATTLPLRERLLRNPHVGGPRSAPSEGALPARGRRTDTGAHTLAQARRGVAALAVLVGLVALIVLAAANRPSFLSAPTHYGYFPHWLAGPLGGLWPWFPRSPHAVKALFTGALVVMYAAYLLALRYVPAVRARWTIAAVLAAHVLLFLCPPLSLTDVFNYIDYGRMGALHGLNPYATIPALEPHSDPSYYLSNWHGLLSPYGPLFTLLTYAVVPLGVAGSLWALKALLAAASLGTIALVWRCARLLGVSERDSIRAVAFVGLNPIVLVWGLGGDHNDFLMVFCIVLAFYLLLRARTPGLSPAREAPATATPVVATPGAAVTATSADTPTAAATDGSRALGSRANGGRARAWLASPAAHEVGAGVALAAAIALKASAAILVPVVLASLLRAPRHLVRVGLGLLAGGVALGACSVAAFGWHLPALGPQGHLVIPMSLPNVVGLALGQGGETETMHTVLSAALVLAVLGVGVWAWRRGDAISGSGWATVALLVTLSWVLPWYVLWVLPLAALSRSRPLRTAALAIGAYLILTWMPLATAMDSALGIHPTATPLGQLHQRYVHELMN